jgi:hypothetical protein
MSSILSQEATQTLFLPIIKNEGKVYVKFKNIWAKKAKAGQIITTITKDGVETTNTAKKGDFIIKNQTAAGEEYILGAAKFAQRYEHAGNKKAGYEEYKPIGKIVAIVLTESLLKSLNLATEFHFIANWGASMVAKKGDFLACPLDYSEIYRIAEKEFFETYKASD